MRNVKSEVLEELSDIFCQLADRKTLKKAILSKPIATDEQKSMISPKIISGKTVLQIEKFTKDHKAYQRNVEQWEKKDFYDLFSQYAQINLLTSKNECQYMRSKSGAEKILGAQKVLKEETTLTAEQGNDKKKNYLLSGKEDFLKKLGVSDQNGRVHDRMQSKFRQINKFVEIIDSIKEQFPSDSVMIYDLCCGKSYLSFAVYHYFHEILQKKVEMVGIDLKSDVVDYCNEVSARLGFENLTFLCGDINAYEIKKPPDLVISLHACDVATDIVLNKASQSRAKVILSTPCCHHELNHTIQCQPLSFVTKHSMLRQKMCDALTDSLRLLKLESEGYAVSALELIDPEDTPKNIMLKGILKEKVDEKKLQKLKEEYQKTKQFLRNE